ncbi:DNA polymerase epsilon subunit 4 [Toxorhynchites rutilus septentrionalis]|uniref:DNA polymerase epsilon subunit 4 n=1 Tax=Toxorhynchites rutilus septentrionalis TaxID=329112 RepID=UPI00247A5561|nr:DNA polymerase epsilon subunit 4 [Toxorhynchites rutilus septentrionalis]
MEEDGSQNNQTNPNKPGLLDSEEIDFGSEPFSGQPLIDKQSDDNIQHSELEENSEEQPTEDNDVGDQIEEEEEEAVENSEIQPGEPASSVTKPGKTVSNEPRLVQFPLSKIKHLMKLDPNVHIVSAEAVFLIARSAELFAQTLTKESYTHTVASKKKTLAKRDVEMTVESVDTLAFLEGMINV